MDRESYLHSFFLDVHRYLFYNNCIISHRVNVIDKCQNHFWAVINISRLILASFITKSSTMLKRPSPGFNPMMMENVSELIFSILTLASEFSMYILDIFMIFSGTTTLSNTFLGDVILCLTEIYRQLVDFFFRTYKIIVV